MPNYNATTGIRYGVIAMNSLDQDLAQDLWYGPFAVNVSEEEAYIEAKRELEAEWEAAREEAEIAASEVDHLMVEADREVFIEKWLEERNFGLDCESHVESVLQNFWDHFQIDEPTIEGTCDGVTYMISWLGGAPLLRVLEGPVGYAKSLCSPCVPGAADLDSGFSTEDDGGYECYVVPQDWLAKEEV